MREIDMFKNLCNNKKTVIDPYICDALRNAAFSGELDLSGYPIGISSWEMLAGILLKSEAIRKLKFCDCMIPPLGFDYVLNALMNNSTISEVNLYGNNINSETTIKLGKMLAVNKSITILILNWNNIGESFDAFSAFCGGLSKNESLEYLDLRNNQICTTGASDLSTALRINHTLKFLDLRWNRLKNQGIECLKNALEFNKSLKELLVKGNFAHLQQTSNIEHSVKKNEEVNTMKMEYDLKVAFLLKELKKVEDIRVQQLTKVTSLSQQRFIEMETKLDEITQILLKKEDQLRNQKLVKMTVEKELSQEKEKMYKLREEFDSLRRKNIELEKSFGDKQGGYLRDISEIEDRLTFEKEQNEKLLKEINDKNIVLEILRDNVIHIKLKNEFCIEEKAAQVERIWKAKLDVLEDKLGKKITDLTEQVEEKELSFLKREQQELKTFQNRAKQDEEEKSSMKAKISYLQGKTADLSFRIVELQKELALISSELATTKQALKNGQIEIKRSEKALNKFSGDLMKANKTIETLKCEVLEEKKKTIDVALKLKEVNLRMVQLKEEENLRSELLASALKRYLNLSGDLYLTE